MFAEKLSSVNTLHVAAILAMTLICGPLFASKPWIPTHTGDPICVIAARDSVIVHQAPSDSSAILCLATDTSARALLLGMSMQWLSEAQIRTDTTKYIEPFKFSSSIIFDKVPGWIKVDASYLGARNGWIKESDYLTAEIEPITPADLHEWFILMNGKITARYEEEFENGVTDAYVFGKLRNGVIIEDKITYLDYIDGVLGSEIDQSMLKSIYKRAKPTRHLGIVYHLKGDEFPHWSFIVNPKTKKNKK